MATIKWDSQARNSRKKILEYGATMWGKAAAQRMYRRIKEHTALLAVSPYLGPQEPLLQNRFPAYRSLVIHEHYKLIYKYIESKDMVWIVDIWDTRREPNFLADSLK